MTNAEKLEELNKQAMQNTFGGSCVGKSTRDKQYNQGEFDYARGRTYTDDCEYYLMCNGL